MKAFIGFMLALLSFVSFEASADYRVEVRDVLAEENIVFESCTIGFFSFTADVGEGSYLYVTCDDEPQPGFSWQPGVYTTDDDEIEEVGINFPAYPENGYIERLDCYLDRFVAEGPGDTGLIQIECGDMHNGMQISDAVFYNGFEGGA